MLTAESFAEAEGVPFWWSKTGIHTLQFDEVSGNPTEQNISLPTIQTFWDNIGSNSRSLVQATYDRLNKKIYWAYPNATETNANKLNNFLILDIPLGAFYPWKVSDEASSTDYIMGLAVYSGYGSDELVLDVVLPNGDDVIQDADDVVSTQFSDFATGDPSIVLLIRDGATGKLTMGTFSGDDFLEWGTTSLETLCSRRMPLTSSCTAGLPKRVGLLQNLGMSLSVRPLSLCRHTGTSLRHPQVQHNRLTATRRRLLLIPVTLLTLGTLTR
jgi:hypothetical protein